MGSPKCCLLQRSKSKGNFANGLWWRRHFDISVSISISINKSIRKICVNRGYISISIRMAIAQAQFTSQESKMADNEVEIGLLLLLSRRNRRRLLMQRKTQRKPRKVWIRDIFTRRKTQGDYYNLVQELKLNATSFATSLQANLFLFLSFKSADFLSYKQG